jgi:hypothetical protein
MADRVSVDFETPLSASVVVCSVCGRLAGSANQSRTSICCTGWLAFSVDSQSPPRCLISGAVSPWQCKASPVSRARFRSIRPSNLRYGDDLASLAGSRHLTDGNARVGREGRDNVQRRALSGSVKRAAHRLAISGDHGGPLTPNPSRDAAKQVAKATGSSRRKRRGNVP